MSVKPYDKKALIQYRMERATESLNDARLMLAQSGSYASAVNRAYYAMFYAALALLITGDYPQVRIRYPNHQSQSILPRISRISRIGLKNSRASA